MTLVKIRIPTPLRGHTAGRDEVQVEVAEATVGAALAALGAAHEGVLAQVLTPEGGQRQFVNLFVGSRNVGELAGLATPVAAGDVIAIIPAVAGGFGCWKPRAYVARQVAARGRCRQHRHGALRHRRALRPGGPGAREDRAAGRGLS